jgi:hypothetical protein
LIEVLLYFLEQGPTEKAILEVCARQGSPYPERIKNAPEVEDGLVLYWLAFLDLTTCRQPGYGMEGPITWLVIAEYADRTGFEGEQREDLFYLMQKMDAAYIDFNAKKINKATPKSNTPKGAGKRKK